VRRWEYRE
jgi:hypothetical protein